MRRSTFTDQPVSYGAIGGTMAPDLMSYPPAGYRPAEHSTQLGSGAERFATASASLMTWGVQRGSGIEVTDTQQGTGERYQGLMFDAEGAPLAEQPQRQSEERFGPDGTPYITAGMTAMLHITAWRMTVTAPVRVVLVIDEPAQVGFAYGTMPGHPESGEILFVVEHRDDDSVWLVIRSFSQPSSARWKLVRPLMRLQERSYTRRYLRALHPAASA
ncbi:DUF1990 family protein [Microterricola viridarii]|uniref:Uncharacterized protein, UPF0548 family n=1 Tax=Microterricola viridarii TaxID=412690 RepID=A0A1H1VSR1_9MICO|nr:DUF1990 domain-containing protein [Microterricola viridarii]SDS87316.1 Uncharacterized protein, UPF0548 family [Microterricola viridarii]